VPPELLEAVKGSPFLLAALVIIAAVVWAAEKLLALQGPMTKLWRAWTDRELNRLKREAALRAERRRIAIEEEQGRVADLSRQLAEVRGEVQWLNRDRNDQRRRDRLRDAYERQLADYVYRLLAAFRSAGGVFADPPDAPELSPLIVTPEDLAADEEAEQDAR